MERLLTLADGDIFQDSEDMSTDNFRKREAARAVVFGENGEVYLLRMSKYGYHKLPGGGMDPGESIEDAVRRECLEEIGCSVEIEKELGEILEYRNTERLSQISYCFIAKQIGPLSETNLEAGEIKEGAQTVVAKGIDEAIELLENDSPASYNGRFIQLRDLRFLREAKATPRSW